MQNLLPEATVSMTWTQHCKLDSRYFTTPIHSLDMMGWVSPHLLIWFMAVASVIDVSLSTKTTVVELRRHLKINAAKAVWPKFVYQSVTFDRIVSVRFQIPLTYTVWHLLGRDFLFSFLSEVLVANEAGKKVEAHVAKSSVLSLFRREEKGRW